MNDFKTIWITMGGVAGVATAYLFGGWSDFLGALLFFQAIDVLTGLLWYAHIGEANSKQFSKGLYRKIGTWIALAVAYRVQIIMPIDGIPLMAVGLGGFCAYEVHSILENLGKLGVATEFLSQYLEQVRVAKEKKEDE